MTSSAKLYTIPTASTVCVTAPHAGSGPSAAPNAIEELPVPYIEIDRNGIITYANRATLALHPPERGSLIGAMAWGLMATSDMEKSCAAYFALMESGDTPPPVHRSLYDCSGEFRDYIMHRSFIHDAEGNRIGMRLACMDVTVANRNLEEAERVRDWMENVFESAPDAILVTDAIGFVISFNPAVEALLGCGPDDLTGQLIEDVIPVLDYSSSENDTLCHNLVLEQPTRGVATIVDHHNAKIQVEIATAPIVDKDNYFTTGVVGILRRIQP
jgi:PAS domain S-box-containing protein